MICGARQTAASPGWNDRRTKARAEATSNGSQSIRPAARVTASNTRQTTGLTVATSAWNSNVPPMAGSPGRRRSRFLNEPIYGTLDVDTNGNLFVGGEGTPFTAFARAMRRSEARHQLLTRVTPVNMGGDLGWRRNQSRRTDGHVIPGGGSLRRPDEQ